MSKNLDDSKREEIDAALQEAQKQGLPPSWNLVIDVGTNHGFLTWRDLRVAASFFDAV